MESNEKLLKEILSAIGDIRHIVFCETEGKRLEKQMKNEVSNVKTLENNPLFSKEFLEKLQEKIDMYSLIKMHLEITNSKDLSTCNCPFHDDDKSSFVFSRLHKQYYCFTCNAQGGPVEFLMNYCRYSFRDAILFLKDLFIEYRC